MTAYPEYGPRQGLYPSLNVFNLATYFSPFMNCKVPPLTITMSGQIIYMAHEEADLLTPGLSALDPCDLIPPNVFSGVRFLTDQLTV